MEKESNLSRFSKTYSGGELLSKYSLDEEGTWEVRGEDPNCDFGGYHHEPFLGYYKGKLRDVIELAVELPGFWSWGSGGRINKASPHKVTKVVAKVERRSNALDRMRMILKLIEANDRAFLERIVPGSLVRIKGMVSHGGIQFYEKEQVLGCLRADPELKPKLQRTWYISLMDTRLIDKNWNWSSVIMLLKRRPSFVAFSINMNKGKPSNGYSQIWQALWNEKVGFLRIEMDLSKSLDEFLEIIDVDSD